jgi:type I restriction enzyme M protein
VSAEPAAVVAPPVEVKTESVPEGRIVDFLTGKHVKDTPEEFVRQNIEKAIVRQYGYAREDCQPEFRIRFGSSNPRVDIVIGLMRPSASRRPPGC